MPSAASPSPVVSTTVQRRLASLQAACCRCACATSIPDGCCASSIVVAPSVCVCYRLCGVVQRSLVWTWTGARRLMRACRCQTSSCSWTSQSRTRPSGGSSARSGEGGRAYYAWACTRTRTAACDAACRCLCCPSLPQPAPARLRAPPPPCHLHHHPPPHLPTSAGCRYESTSFQTIVKQRFEVLRKEVEAGDASVSASAAGTTTAAAAAAAPADGAAATASTASAAPAAASASAAGGTWVQVNAAGTIEAIHAHIRGIADATIAKAAEAPIRRLWDGAPLA